MKFKRLVLLMAVLLTGTITANDALQDVISAEHRAQSSARDDFRNPQQTLTFFDIQPTHKVLEITPGGSGWYTEILAPYLRENGHLTIAHFNPESTNNYYRKNYKKLIDKFELAPDLYGKVEIGVFEAPGIYQYGEPGSFDRVVTFRNVHNWTKNGDDEMKRIFKSFYDALKPGGMLGVIDHRMPEDRELDFKGGYVKESYVISLAEQVGFELKDKSEINANPKDDVDVEKGVWRLPPSLDQSEETHETYRAIGESDRMTLLFIKPDNQ